VEVERKGGVILTMVDDVEDVVFVLKESFNEESGGDKGFSVERGSVHDEKGCFAKKLVGLVVSLDDCLKKFIAISSSSYSL
jgi:hypothetical protein